MYPHHFYNNNNKKGIIMIKPKEWVLITLGAHDYAPQFKNVDNPQTVKTRIKRAIIVDNSQFGIEINPTLLTLEERRRLIARGDVVALVIVGGSNAYPTRYNDIVITQNMGDYFGARGGVLSRKRGSVVTMILPRADRVGDVTVWDNPAGIPVLTIE